MAGKHGTPSALGQSLVLDMWGTVVSEEDVTNVNTDRTDSREGNISKKFK